MRSQGASQFPEAWGSVAGMQRGMVEAAGIELDWVRRCNSLMARDLRLNVFAGQWLSQLNPVPWSLLQSSGFLHRLGDILETAAWDFDDRWPPYEILDR